jgi:hypothetical protein
MGLLVRRAAELSKMRDFGLQNVANMLWATCFLRIHSEEATQSVCDAISDSLLSIDAEAILSGVCVCVCVCVWVGGWVGGWVCGCVQRDRDKQRHIERERDFATPGLTA